MPAPSPASRHKCRLATSPGLRLATDCASRGRGGSRPNPSNRDEVPHLFLILRCRGYPCPRKCETHGGFHIKSSDLPFPLNPEEFLDRRERLGLRQPRRLSH